MKIFKNIYVLLLSIVITLSFVISNTFIADEISKSDDNSATWEVEEKTTNTINGVTHSLMYGKTSDSNETLQGNQKVNVFEMKADGINSKLVTWAISGKTTYSRSGLSTIAKDYEKNHPGWIVVAGINGDQYYTKYGSGLGTDGSFYYPNQPYYPMIIDGERRFPITPSGNSSANYIGIANNNEQDSFITASRLAGLKLEILNDDDNVIYISDVEKINETPAENETSVWFTYNSPDKSSETIEHNVSTSNKLYVIEEVERAYMNNSLAYQYSGAADSLFGKGTITLVTNEYNFTSGTFGIETSNIDLVNKLNQDTKVRIQYYYENEEMNHVESSMGYHSIQRMNNQDVKTTQAYDICRYNRSIFGKKADGTYILMTVSKGEYSGTTHNESNAILKQFGVTEAYQQDGGGSVTAIIRNANDEFDIVNESSDTGTKERQILSGCFFVVRDSGFRSYQKDSTKDSITITKVNNFNDAYIYNVKAEVNNQIYDITNDSLTINNLKYDTEYIINLTYDIEINGKTISATQQITAHTDSFIMPSSGVKTVEVTANSIILQRVPITDNEILSVVVTCNNQTYDLLDINNYVEIKNLTPSTIYTLTIDYQVKDIIDGKVYKNTEEIVEITRKYNIPKIKEFKIDNKTKNKISVTIDVLDDFNLVYSCYIMYNGKQFECDTLSGTYTIENVNLKNEDYELTLVVQYKENNMFKSLNSETLKVTKIETSCSKCNKSSQNLINTLSLLSLLYIYFRKRK